MTRRLPRKKPNCALLVFFEYHLERVGECCVGVCLVGVDLNLPKPTTLEMGRAADDHYVLPYVLIL